MEAYSSYSSSSSSSLHLPLNNPQSAIKKPKPQPLSVRKTTSKSWKKHIAPMPPTPPRVYKVKPIDFRDVVQKLTGASQIQPPLQKVAPPPLNLNDTSVKSSLTDTTTLSDNSTDNLVGGNGNGFSMSPSSFAWCSSFPLLSPGTLSTFEQRAVL